MLWESVQLVALYYFDIIIMHKYTKKMIAAVVHVAKMFDIVIIIITMHKFTKKNEQQSLMHVQN